MLTDGQIINNLPIDEIIHKYPKSGQKQVFLVLHRDFGKIILKVVEGNNDRVKREVSIVTENDFDNVPEILSINDYDIDGEKGIFLCEEFVDGITLRDVLLLDKLPLADAMELAESMLTILVQLEAKGIVHRDIKPENIIKSHDGRWFLIDFGIARALNSTSLTLTNVRMGPHTPGYGAPELFQYSKKDIDSRADIFSLGVVLFEALTGKHPFVRGDELDVNEIWYNTATITPQSVLIEGDNNMQVMGLIQTFMQKHVTRRPRNAAKAMEWFKSVQQDLNEGVD